MTVAIVALLYGLLSLDHFMVGPFLLSRPIVTGSVVGYVFGFPVEGVALGLTAESFWVRVPPVGNGQWDVGLIAALSAVWSMESAGKGHVMPRALALSLLLAIPFGVFARTADAWVRRNTRILSLRGVMGVERGLIGPLRNSLGFASGVWVLKSVVLFFLAESIGEAVFRVVLPCVTGIFGEGLDMAWALWPALGAATLLNHFSVGAAKSRRLITNGKGS